LHIVAVPEHGEAKGGDSPGHFFELRFRGRFLSLLQHAAEDFGDGGRGLGRF
jgi:hypothetical protein